MVQELIRRGQRRFLLNEAMAQVAFAAAVSAGGLALLLILGTRFFEWWTVILPTVAGVGVGVWQVRKRAPGTYETAVRLDENAGLHDALSTAYHFGETATTPGSAEFRSFQLAQAESVAGTVNLESAVPFTFPRAVYVMGALCLLATGLTALRFRTGQGLDLQRPLTEVLFEDQAAKATKKQMALAKPPGSWTQQAEEMLQKMGLKPSDDRPVADDPESIDKAIEQAMKKPNGGDGKANKGQDGEKAAPGKDLAPEDSEGSDPIDGAADKNGKDPKEGQGASEAKGDQGDKGSTTKGEGKQDSLLSKLKDAVSSLMSNSPSKPGVSDEKSSDKKGKSDPQPKDKKGQSSQMGKPEKGDSDVDESDPDGDSMGGQKGQGKQNSASTQRQAQEGSGIGAQDGLKDIKAAEQIKAMGKISEIIGKRSQQVSGETSVEVQSGNQQLHTAYGKTNAAHGQTDGDVTRDEIPVALQSYVQQYFSEVRKAAGSKKGGPQPPQQ